MRAILIDSKNKNVSEIIIDDTKTLEDWYKAVDCELVEVAHYINEHDSILVDEEGLLKNPTDFFTYNGAHQPFAGNGLIVGVDPNDGESIDCQITLEEVKRNTCFLSQNEVIEYEN
jgi:hypothetical protein